MGVGTVGAVRMRLRVEDVLPRLLADTDIPAWTCAIDSRTGARGDELAPRQSDLPAQALAVYKLDNFVLLSCETRVTWAARIESMVVLDESRSLLSL